jgi:hypothetical protein
MGYFIFRLGCGDSPLGSRLRCVGVEKLITVGQQMGNTTVKTSQRYSTMTSDEDAVN